MIGWWFVLAGGVVGAVAGRALAKWQNRRDLRAARYEDEPAEPAPLPAQHDGAAQAAQAVTDAIWAAEDAHAAAVRAARDAAAAAERFTR